MASPGGNDSLMRRTLCFLIGLSVGLSIMASAMASATRATAEPRALAAAGSEDREAKARELFALGRYEEALAIYGKLYADSPHPTYLRNIGRCYQNLRRPYNAISSFEDYLRQSPNLPADQRHLVEGYIREMRELKAKQAASAAPPAGDAPPAASKPRPAQVSLATAPGPEADVPHPAGADQGNPKRTAAFAVGAAAVVALGVGAFFGVRAISKGNAVDAHCPGDACDMTGLTLDHDARTAARIADVALGAGIVAGAVATYLFITSRVESAPWPAVSFLGRRARVIPEAGPRGGTIHLSMQW